MKTPVALLAVTALSGVAAADILVFDENTNNQYALQAANSLQPGKVTRAGIGSFNALLTSKSWDVVAFDCPSSYDPSNITALTDYINGGGRAVVSFWTYASFPGLLTSLGVTSQTAYISTAGSTLNSDGGAAGAAIFSGVTMPHSTWFDSWADDGEDFGLLGASTRVGTFSGHPGPSLVVGGSGKTIATFVQDEWSGKDAIQLWVNEMSYTGIPAPGTAGLLALGGLVAARRRRD